MPYPIPKITFDDGSGPATLTFTYPDIQKPKADPLQALRHDSISSSGIRQCMVERVDTLKTVQVENVPWADMPAWQVFMAYAVQGGSFTYYPDAAAANFQTWELVDDNFDPKFNSFGLSKLTLKLRQVPGGAAFP